MRDPQHSVFSNLLINAIIRTTTSTTRESPKTIVWHIKWTFLPSCLKVFTPLSSGFTIKHDDKWSHLFKVNCLLIPMLVGIRTCPGQITLFSQRICWLTRYKRRVRFYLMPIIQFSPPTLLWLPLRGFLRETKSIPQQNYDSNSKYLF